MALRAADARPHEDQSRSLADRLRVFARHGAEEVDGTIPEIASVRCQKFTHKLIVWLIVRDALVHPAVVSSHGLRPDPHRVLALDAQQVAPFQRPEIRKFGAFQQPVDQLGALVRSRVFQKRTRLGGCGQNADHVQIDAAQKLLVRAQTGRWNSQRLQLGMNQLVDLVVRRQFGEWRGERLRNRHLATAAFRM